MHSIVTTFRGAVIKVEVANFCATMDTLIDQDDKIIDNSPTHQSYLILIFPLAQLKEQEEFSRF